jgi:tetratricopeptide (TPR) repeat protein
MVHREFIGLMVLIVAGIVGLFLTRAAAASNRQMHREDAARWFHEAQGDVAASRPADAVPALRHAVAIDRDNAVYRLALASALAASGEDEAARQVLVSLRQLTPEDPEINLQLARLESRRQDRTAAIEYYQNALHGVWPADRGDSRRNVRVELIKYLLRYGQQSRALSELLVLSANLPDDAVPQRDIGNLFLSAGDPRRALDHFGRALRLAPGDAGALAGAGEASFAIGDYTRARTYLRALASPPERLADMRVIADAVLTADPLAPRLTREERQRRLEAGLDQAERRLDSCLALDDPLRQAVAAVARAATPGRRLADPELIEQGVDVIGRVEQSADERCGRGSPLDRAWRTIAARHGGESP